MLTDLYVSTYRGTTSARKRGTRRWHHVGIPTLKVRNEDPRDSDPGTRPPTMPEPDPTERYEIRVNTHHAGTISLTVSQSVSSRSHRAHHTTVSKDRSTEVRCIRDFRESVWCILQRRQLRARSWSGNRAIFKNVDARTSSHPSGRDNCNCAVRHGGGVVPAAVVYQARSRVGR